MYKRGILNLLIISAILLVFAIGCAHNKSETKLREKRATDEEIEKLAETFKNHKQISIERKGTIEINKNITIAGKGKSNTRRDVNVVNNVINSHKGAIEFCYRKELKNNPKLKGKMLLTITILPNGNVKNSKILYSSVRNKKVENCVINSVRKWKDFPVIDEKYGIVEVDFKYLFY